MSFDASNPHTLYVVAAYAVAGAGYLALILHTFFKARGVAKALKKLERP